MKRYRLVSLCFTRDPIAGIPLVLFLLSTFFLSSCSRNPLKQWTPDQRLTNHMGISKTSYNNARCVAASGNTIHLAWYDLREAVEAVYYQRSTDGGKTWRWEVRLSPELIRSQYPSLAVSRPYVHAAWVESRGEQEGITYRRSTDGGRTWKPEVQLSPAGSCSQYPSLAVSGPCVHAAWVESRGEQEGITYRRSTDGGNTWEQAVRLTPEGSSPQFPCIAVSGTNVHIAWADSSPGNWEIYAIRSTDGGAQWQRTDRLTQDAARSQHPAIAVFGSTVSVAWEDDRDGNRTKVFYKRSTDEGLTWEPDLALTSVPYSSTYPSLAASEQNVHVVWDAWVSGNNDEIFYKRSRDGGKTWDPDLRLTHDPQYSSLSSVTVSGPQVHVVWQDYRDANREIYIKGNPRGNRRESTGPPKPLAERPEFILLELLLLVLAVVLTISLVGRWSKAFRDETSPSGGMDGQAKKPRADLKRETSEVFHRSPESQGHFDRGIGLEGQRSWEQAEQAFRNTLRSAPNDWEACFQLGMVQIEQGKTAPAMAALREAIRSKPDHARAHYHLGRLLEEREQNSKAEGEYRKAIWYLPDDAEAHFRLGSLLEKQALLLRPAESPKPDVSPENSEAQEKYKAAEWEYHETLRLEPDHPEALKHIATVLDAQKRAWEARRFWERASELEKDPEERKRILEHLTPESDSEEEEDITRAKAGVNG